MEGRQSIRLIMVNHTAMSADLVRVALAEQPAIEVLGNANTSPELAALLFKGPDVALVGSYGARKSSTTLEFLEQIAETRSTVRSIVVSEDMSQEDVVALFHHGARGLICKAQTDVPLLIKCIRCVSAGQVWAKAGELEQLLCSLTAQPRSLRVKDATGGALLSEREEQVLLLLARGLTNRDLAKTLNLSEHTIKNHLFRIFDKLGVSNRMEAVLCAIRRNPPGSSAEGAATVAANADVA